MRAWSEAAENKLRVMYPSTSTTRLAFLLKRTKAAVKSRACLLGLSKGRKQWTKTEERELRRRFPHETTKAISMEMHRTALSISQRAAKLGLRKTEKHLSSELSGRIQRGRSHPAMLASQFPKGHVPANKGLRRPGWAAGRMAETQFKKGRQATEANNYVPIGTEKYDVKRKVIVRKITDDPSIVPTLRWQPVHRMVWEAANGKVPAGHIVIFKPGMKTFDTAQITLDHVELVTLAENMRRNSYHNNYPKELALCIQLKGQLTRQINKRIRNEK